MTESQEPQVSEAQIAVHWREEEYYPPPPKFVDQANANDPAIIERFTEDKFPGCFKEYADLLTWDQPCTRRWTPAIRRSGSGLSAAS
jgi:acetyl-CoA synthetase